MLHLLAQRLRTRRTRGGDDRGAAAVEFGLLILPLSLIVFGIISFGFMLTFRQTLSQAATEGARAAAVELEDGNRQSEGLAAVNDAMDAVDKTCGSGGLTCTVSAPYACGSTQCVKVTLTYSYRANPMVPSPPLVGNLMPQNMTYTATVRVS
jgi:Flp pilus assembly protein TadG